MKSLYRLLLNLCSFALLVFALYLNFIKKEEAEAPVQLNNTKTVENAAAKGPQQDQASKTTVHTAALK